MKVICIRGGCEWLNGYMCRAYCEYMRVIRTPAEIQADKHREDTRLKKARAKQARREIKAFEEGDNETIPAHMGGEL